MAEIKRQDLIDNKALKAPLELADNLDQVVAVLDKIVISGKKIDQNLDFAKSTREVAKETNALTISQRELEKVDKQIQVATARQNTEFIKKQRQLQNIRKRTRQLVNEEEELLGLEERLIKRNKELREERRKLTGEEENYLDRLKEINDELDENNEKLKENSSQVEQLKFQVADYRGQLEGLTVQIFEASQQEGGIRKLFQATVDGLISATRAGLAFIATPIGAVLALIVAGIASLTAVINNNQAAADQFNIIWGGISSVLEEVFSRVVKLAGAFLKLISGDLKGAIQDASDAFDNLGESLQKSFEEGQKLVRLQVALEKATLSSTVAIAQLNNEVQRQNLLADDATRSFAQREAANRSAREAEAALQQVNIDLLSREKEIIDLQVAQAERRGTINRELAQQQADATAALIEAEGELLLLELENEKIRRELKQDRLERDLDILIDGFDNVKTINERIISDDRNTLRARAEALDQLTALSENSFNKQIDVIRQFTDVAFDENELLAEQDAKRLNERIRNLGLSEVIEGRLLEVIRERRVVLADLGELEESIQQANIDRLQEIADNEELSVEQRIEALLQLAEAREDLLQRQLDQGLLNEQEFAQKVVDIQQDAADKIAQINLGRFEDDFADTQLDAETERLNLLIELNRQFQSGEITSVEEFEKRKLQIQADAKRQALQDELNFLEERRKLLEDAGIDTSQIEQDIAKVRLEISNANNEELLAQEAQLQRAIQDLRNTAYNGALEILDNFNEKADEKRQAELEDLDEKEATQLELIGEARQRQGETDEEFAIRQQEIEAQKQAVTDEFARKREAVEQQQQRADRRRAVFEKALAASEIVFNTGRAITSVLPNIPLSVLIGAIGAIQLATVLTRPIPAFAKGVKGAPEGLAIINELGPELIEDKSGNLKMIHTDGPTLTYLSGGENIYPFEQSKEMLRRDLEQPVAIQHAVNRDGELIREMRYGFKRMEKALRSSNQNLTYDQLERLFNNMNSWAQTRERYR